MPNRSLRILLIDDDEDDFILIRDMLSDRVDARLSLDWVSSFETGLDLVLSRSHDAYLLDYRLGERTGIELLREALARGAVAPIILLTGLGDPETDERAMQEGAADFLVKGQISAPLLERSIRYSVFRQQNLENFRSLLDSTFEGIIVHDVCGTILECNRAASELFGTTPSEIQKSSLLSFISEESLTSVLQVLQSAGATSTEANGVKRDGTRIYLEISSKPYSHREGPARLTAIRDVTAKKEMEAQILLQDRLASIGLLASSLAHEIGTPLGVIRGRAEYLTLETEGNSAIQKNVDIIISQIDRVSKLIRSLLDLARGESAEGTQFISARRVIIDVLDLMNHEIQRHGILVENTLAIEDEYLVKAQSGPLHQVFLNLLVNSLHAIQSGMANGLPGPHRIRILASRSDTQCLLSVEDTGCGISKSNLRNLFKPFFTTKEIGKGTGLGLVTSYRIIESWNGTLSAFSEEGKGARFQIALPRG